MLGRAAEGRTMKPRLRTPKTPLTLHNGDHMTQAEFHRRDEAYPRT
jgi:hypothetical protein